MKILKRRLFLATVLGIICAICIAVSVWLFIITYTGESAPFGNPAFGYFLVAIILLISHNFGFRSIKAFRKSPLSSEAGIARLKGNIL